MQEEESELVQSLRTVINATTPPKSTTTYPVLTYLYGWSFNDVFFGEDEAAAKEARDSFYQKLNGNENVL